MGSLCSKRYIVSNCEKDPEKLGENDVSYIQTTYTKYREDDPIYNDSRENSKEEQGYFSGSDVSSVLEEADTPGNGKNVGNENQNNEQKEDLKVEDGSFFKLETSRERQTSYNNGGFIDEENEIGLEYKDEIDEMDDCNYRAVAVSSKDVKERHNSYQNEGFTGKADHMDEMDDCMIKTKPKKDTGNSYHNGGLIDETDEIDDCIVHKAFVVFPDDLGEIEEKTEREIIPTQSTMFNANNVLINNLEEKEEVDQIANNEKHQTSSEFKKLHSENLEEKTEKVQPDDSITITQSTIFISGNDIINYEKIEEMKEENAIHTVSQFQSDHSEDIKEMSLIDNITSQSTTYKSGDLFFESSEEINGLTQPIDINTQSFIYKAGDIFVNGLDEETEGMTESVDFAMNEPENMNLFNDIVTLPTVYNGEAAEINNLDNILSKSTIYKSGVEIAYYSGEIDENTDIEDMDTDKIEDIKLISNARYEGTDNISLQQGDIVLHSTIYKAANTFFDDPAQMEEMAPLDDILIKANIYKAGDLFDNDPDELTEIMQSSDNSTFSELQSTKSSSKEDEMRLKSTVYKAGDIYMDDLTQAEKIPDHYKIVFQSTVNKAGELFTHDSIQTENMIHTQDVNTEELQEVCQLDELVSNFTTYVNETEETIVNENIVSQSTLYKAGNIYHDKPEETKDTYVSKQYATYRAEDTFSDHPEEPEKMTEMEDIDINKVEKDMKFDDIISQTFIYKAGELFTNDHAKLDNIKQSGDIASEKIQENPQLDNIHTKSIIYKAGKVFNDNLASKENPQLDYIVIQSNALQDETYFEDSLEETNDVSIFEVISDKEEREKITPNDIVMESAVYKGGDIFNDHDKETNEISQTNDIVVHSAIYKAGDACNNNFTQIRDMNPDEDIVEEKTPFNEHFTQSYITGSDDSDEVEETTKFDNVLSQSTLYKAGENFTHDPEEIEEISHSDDIITKTNTYKAGEILTDIRQNTQDKAEFDPLVTIYKNQEDFIEPDNILTNYRDTYFTYNPEEIVENNQNDQLTKYTVYESDDFTDDYTENIDILSVNVEQMDEYNNGYSKMQENIDHNLQTKTSIYKAGEVSAKVDTPKGIPDINILTQSIKFKGGEIYTDDLEETDNGKEDIFANKLFSICKEKKEEIIPEDNLLNDNIQSSPNKNESYKVSRQIWLMQ